jgi:hypothetical protein
MQARGLLLVRRRLEPTPSLGTKIAYRMIMFFFPIPNYFFIKNVRSSGEKCSIA